MEIAGLIWRCEPLADASGLEHVWSELEDRSDCSFFLTWDWIGTWLDVSGNLSPLLLSVYDGSTVVALALITPTSDRRNFRQRAVLLLHQTGDPCSDGITIEYNGIVTDRLYTKRVEGNFFAFLAKAGFLDNGAEIQISLATELIGRLARESGLVVSERARMPSWFVDLTAVRKDGNQYLDYLSSNTRQQIRRSLRMYQARGPVEATTATSVDRALEYFNELKLLHQKAWRDRDLPGSFASAYFEQFHRALLRRCVERGTVEVVRVTAGSYVIGQVYNFVRGGHVYAYQTGFSYETEAKLKPGLVCHSVCIQRHLNAGAFAYDFMGGHARYKANLGIRGPDLFHYVIERKTMRSQSLKFARYVKDRLIGHNARRRS